MKKIARCFSPLATVSFLLICSGCGGSVDEIGPANETPRANREAERKGMLESAEKGGMSKTQMDKMMKYNNQQKTK